MAKLAVFEISPNVAISQCLFVLKSRTKTLIGTSFIWDITITVSDLLFLDLTRFVSRTRAVQTSALHFLLEAPVRE